MSDDKTPPNAGQSPRRRIRGRKAEKQQQNSPSRKPPFRELPSYACHDRNIGMQHERLVGRLVMSWANIEGIIQSIIWEILKLNFDDGKAVAAHNDVQTNMTILRNIATRRLNEDRLGLLYSSLDRVKDAQEYRNTVVHSQWI